MFIIPSCTFALTNLFRLLTSSRKFCFLLPVSKHVAQSANIKLLFYSEHFKGGRKKVKGSNNKYYGYSISSFGFNNMYIVYPFVFYGAYHHPSPFIFQPVVYNNKGLTCYSKRKKMQGGCSQKGALTFCFHFRLKTQCPFPRSKV